MNKIIYKIIMVIGALLFVDTIALSLVTNFNFGLIMTLIISLGLLVYGIYFDKINIITSHGILKYMKYFILIGLILMVCLIGFLAIYGQSDNVTYKEDAVIVLGAGINGDVVTAPLAYRLEAAIRYFRKNPNVIIVVSGGQGFQEDIPESLAMKRYLINKGIPEVKIFRENKATSTFENFIYSKQILDNYFNKPYKVVLITNNFHVYRATQISKIAGINSTHYHADLDWYEGPIDYFRESIAIIKLWILKR